MQKYSQAERLIKKFGGARKLCRALKLVGVEIDASSVYRWAYPEERNGTGGLVPSKHWDGIHKAARLQGISITLKDKDPQFRVITEDKQQARRVPGFARMRAEFLMCNKEKPCALCNDPIGPFEVDHIQPVSKYPKLAGDSRNLQKLCRRCNQGKRDLEDIFS